jgi:hypothetical protein
VTHRQKSLVLAAVHVLIAASLGGKLIADRVTRPRLWVKTAPIDPNMPIRGRYVRLGVEVDGSGDLVDRSVALDVRNGRLTAVPTDQMTGMRITSRGATFVLDPPIAFFIPEHAADPSVRQPGEELWVEVTVPRAGPPRPVRLGVRKDGTLTPLDLR